MDAENPAEKKEEKHSHPEASKPKKKKDSDLVENIVALSVFFLVGLIMAAVFTRGFGLFNSGDSTERFQVQLGNDPFRGSSEPKVLMVVFSEYECPFCSKAELTINSLMEKYDDSMLLIFKDFPLTVLHPNSLNAALAAECAKEQDQYWEYHNFLYEHNDKLGIEYLKEYAKLLGLDSEEFNACLDSQKYLYEVENDKKAGVNVGVSGVPTFFINGRRIVGARPESEFINVIEEELKLNG